jgi:hypothetical protein
MAKSKMKRKPKPKSVLKLPDLEQSRSPVLNSLTSPSSQRTYHYAINGPCSPGIESLSNSSVMHQRPSTFAKRRAMNWLRSAIIYSFFS